MKLIFVIFHIDLLCTDALIFKFTCRQRRICCVYLPHRRRSS